MLTLEGRTLGGATLAAALLCLAAAPVAGQEAERTARDRHMNGRHFTRADFAQTSARTALDFLIRMSPGLRSGNGVSLSREVIWRGNSSQPISRRACAVSYFIDGVQVTNSNDVHPEMLAPVATLPIEAVEEIRIYRGPSEVPARYARPNVRCGAIAITTRGE